ncbi:hypothetical protein AAIR29_12285 [Psychrobacter sp. FBL11]|uniref:Lipoprotein n=1 Tax=Psychrobacter saeujeotis TaxID=3143436 RepID=A0ABU9XB41_9GAMM
MKLKLLALAGIMTASMGLTACDSSTENAAEDLSDAQEEVQDAQEELNEAGAEGEAVPADAEAAAADAEADIAEAQAATATDEMDAEVPVDGDTTSMDVASETDTAADEVVVVEEPAQ